MEIIALSPGIKKLNFGPAMRWPSVLPPVIWQGFQISGFSSEHGLALKISDETLIEDALSDLYPKLSLVELANLFALVKKHELSMEWSTFLFRYGVRHSTDLESLFEKIVTLPDKVKNWLIQKDASARDFSPFKSVEHIQKLFPWLELMVTLSPTRTEFVRALEWLVELHLMNTDFEKLLKGNTDSWAKFSKALEAARFPMAQAQARVASEIGKNLPWPQKLEAKYTRKGDRAGFEVKFFVHSRADLVKQLDGLKNVEATMRERSIDRI